MRMKGKIIKFTDDEISNDPKCAMKTVIGNHISMVMASMMEHGDPVDLVDEMVRETTETFGLDGALENITGTYLLCLIAYIQGDLPGQCLAPRLDTIEPPEIILDCEHCDHRDSCTKKEKDCH
jgi:hypothetical protein